MAPGRGAPSIRKAMLRPPPPKKGEKPLAPPTMAKEEILDDILVGDTWIILKAEKSDPFDPRRTYMAVRIVHASTVLDSELLDPLPNDEEKGQTR